jgi:hypothetical protein
VAGDLRPERASKGNINVLCIGARVMGVSMVIAAWREGVMQPFSPLPLIGSLVSRPERA